MVLGAVTTFFSIYSHRYIFFVKSKEKIFVLMAYHKILLPGYTKLGCKKFKTQYNKHILHEDDLDELSNWEPIEFQHQFEKIVMSEFSYIKMSKPKQLVIEFTVSSLVRLVGLDLAPVYIFNKRTEDFIATFQLKRSGEVIFEDILDGHEQSLSFGDDTSVVLLEPNNKYSLETTIDMKYRTVYSPAYYLFRNIEYSGGELTPFGVTDDKPMQCAPSFLSAIWLNKY